MKDKFTEDFYRFLGMIKNHENFAFSRFSDGELFILQNKKVVLADGLTQTGDTKHPIQYAKEDFKEFIPGKHEDTRKRLFSALTYSSPATHFFEGYFRGLPCPCCVSSEDFEWIKQAAGPDDGCLTYANLFVNSNYPRFINEMLPEIAKRAEEDEIFIVCNENANLSGLPFEVDKDWRVGYNCPVNDVGLIDEIDEFIYDEDIEDAIFLFSAASLSEMLCHELYKKHPSNTYLDIGTTLNMHLGLSTERGYLKGFWGGTGHPDLFKHCTGI